MSRKVLNWRQKAERTVQIARDSCALFLEMVRGGQSLDDIKAFAARASRANSILSGIIYRMHSPESVPVWTQALRDALDFIETHKDPYAEQDDAFVVERFLGELAEKYTGRRTVDLNWTLEQWLSSVEGGSAQVELYLAQHLETVAVVSGGRHRHMAGRPISASEALPAKVDRREFQTVDILSFAELVRERARKEMAGA